MTLRGVDVANFQGPPGDWRSHAGQIDWAAVKITELSAAGPYVDPDAAADWAVLKAAGLGRIAYLFGHPGIDYGRTADFFAETLDALGVEDGDAVCLDHETTDGVNARDVATWAHKTLLVMRMRFDRKPLLYTYLSFAEAGNCAGLGGYPLWIADPSSPAGHPRVPSPWKSWAIHQYSTAGGIDRDIAAWADRKAMAAAVGKKQRKPKEPTMKDLGGSFTDAAALAAGRWPDGTEVIAAANPAGQLSGIRWTAASKWGGWTTIHPGPVHSAPVITTWGDLFGRLYFTNAAGHVIQLGTNDAGKTWA
jgi:GH25 family lysozyme M1 (1,4-beta-N-acetylmuramidase)